MPTMRFTSVDGVKKFYFDSSVPFTLKSKIDSVPSRLELRNKKEGIDITEWDVYGVTSLDKPTTPLRKLGILEYLPPLWPGGPSQPWYR